MCKSYLMMQQLPAASLYQLHGPFSMLSFGSAAAASSADKTKPHPDLASYLHRDSVKHAIEVTSVLSVDMMEHN